MSQRVSFKVHGQVQGVFFRAFTKEKASNYGITGWVKNTNDEKVVGEAQGDADSIKKLLKDLNDGPRHAHVVKLEKQEIDTVEGEGGFEQK